MLQMERSLAQTACKNIGDTVVVENCHQHMKDLLAAARHEQIGRAQEFQAPCDSD